MKFCTNCGNPIHEGEVHVCSQEAVPAPAAAAIVQPVQATPAPPTAARSQVDKSRLIGLLKNPLSALQLRGETDLAYGLIGLAASLLGFMIWAWSLKRNILHAVYNVMGVDESWGSAYDQASEQFHLLKPMFITAVVSLGVLMVGAILLGRWMGQNKASWKEGFATLGAVQLVSGAGFLISALMLFVSLPAGLVLLTVVLLSTLVLTAYASLQFFQVPQHRVLHVIALLVLLQVVAVLLIMGSSASQAIGEMKDSFSNLMDFPF